MNSKILFFVLTFIIIVSCSNPTGSSPAGSSGNNDGSQVIPTKAKIYDNNGTFLGNATSISSATINIFTSTEYFVIIKWDGLIGPSYMQYSGLDRTGTPLFMSSDAYRYYGKTVFYDDGTLFKIKDIDSSGLAIVSASISTYQSSSNAGVLTNMGSPTSFPNGYSPIELTTTTRAEIGLPSTIALPISIVW